MMVRSTYVGSRPDWPPLWSRRSLYLWMLLSLILQSSAQQLLSLTGCSYPNLHNRDQCGLHDDSIRPLVCDPQNAVSMSELQVIAEKIEKLKSQHGRKCVCSSPQHSGLNDCWYKFAFAFLREMVPVLGANQESYSRHYCPVNSTLLHGARLSTRAEALTNGRHFARLIRQKSAFGHCEEDVLFLVVMNRPDQLIDGDLPSPGHPYPPPVIFISYGSLVSDRVEVLDFDHEHVLNRSPDSLQKIVSALNTDLSNGYPLKTVLESLVDQVSDALIRADVKNVHRIQHIPPTWAIIVFATCGVLCVLMAIGLCLMKSSVRRASTRGKQMGENPRRWKAGFVGGMWVVSAQHRTQLSFEQQQQLQPQQQPSVMAREFA
uniref:GPI-anchored protein n=1 Tax=Steinernema glaseri TaxID=37863 RepID=A0A1I7YLY1_9BILA